MAENDPASLYRAMPDRQLMGMGEMFFFIKSEKCNFETIKRIKLPRPILDLTELECESRLRLAM